MGKARVSMTNWCLTEEDGEYNLAGYADEHPKLGKHVYVAWTSKLENFSCEDDILTYETRNTIYLCPLKYMAPRPYQMVDAGWLDNMAHKADHSDSILDQLIAVSAKLSMKNQEPEQDELMKKIIALQKNGQQEIAQMEEKRNRHLMEMAERYEDCVYMEVSSVSQGSKLAYHMGDHIGVIEPRVHTGMFQDSILYVEYDYEEQRHIVDFRYFPKGWGYDIEVYCWLEDIKQAVIKNEKGYIVNFNGENIAPGETKVFLRKDYGKEGEKECNYGK